MRVAAAVAPWRAGTLLYKEVLRFWKVSFQTVAAPVLTAVLYLLIFGHVLEDHVKVYDRISYTSLSGAGPRDDERAAERLCQQLVLADPKQDHRQSGVPAAHAPVALEPGSLPTSAPPWCAAWWLARACLLVTVWFAPSAWQHRCGSWCLRVLGAAHAGHAGPDRRHCGPRSSTSWRPSRTFVIMPMTFLSRRVLFHPLLAGVLAGRAATSIPSST